MKTVIPEKVVTTCDCCGVELTASNSRHEGYLFLKQHALDLQGFACADASIKHDLCDTCLSRISTAINVVYKGSRK